MAFYEKPNGLPVTLYLQRRFSSVNQPISAMDSALLHDEGSLTLWS